MKKPIDEMEVGQRFTFADAIPCVYAGESPCGRYFAYWQYNARFDHWGIEETSDGEEEVECE